MYDHQNYYAKDNGYFVWNGQRVTSGGNTVYFKGFDVMNPEMVQETLQNC